MWRSTTTSRRSASGKGHAEAGFAHGSATAVLAALDDEFHAVCTAAAELAVSLGQPERVIAPLQEPDTGEFFGLLRS
jgi:hypothetical protein